MSQNPAVLARYSYNSYKALAIRLLYLSVNLASMQQVIRKLQWLEYLKVVFLEILNLLLCRVFANQVTNVINGRKFFIRLAQKPVKAICMSFGLFV